MMVIELGLQRTGNQHSQLSWQSTRLVSGMSQVRCLSGAQGTIVIKNLSGRSQTALRLKAGKPRITVGNTSKLLQYLIRVQLSLVEYSIWIRGAVGSNPTTLTIRSSVKMAQTENTGCSTNSCTDSSKKGSKNDTVQQLWKVYSI